MKQKILFNFSTGYNWWYKLYHPWETVIHLWDEVVSFVHRGLYGYAVKDTWSLDMYLATWMPSAIRRIANGHGYPYGLTEKRWKIILEKIARGFEATYLMDEDYMAPRKQVKKWVKERDKGLELFAKYYSNLWGGRATD